MYSYEGDEQVVDVMKNDITIHPQYDRQAFDYDIAVIKLKKSVSFTTRIKPVCINTEIDFTGML